MVNGRKRKFTLVEILGGIGLILSLIFVGIQIRENNRATMSAMASASVDSISAWYIEIGNEEQSSALVYRFFVDPNSLSAEERFQATMNMHGLFLVFQNSYYLANEGTLERSILRSLTAAMLSVKGTPGLHLFWKQRRSIFMEEFQNFVDSILDSDRTVPKGLFGAGNPEPPSNKAIKPPAKQTETH